MQVGQLCPYCTLLGLPGTDEGVWGYQYVVAPNGLFPAPLKEDKGTQVRMRPMVRRIGSDI